MDAKQEEPLITMALSEGNFEEKKKFDHGKNYELCKLFDFYITMSPDFCDIFDLDHLGTS